MSKKRLSFNETIKNSPEFVELQRKYNIWCTKGENENSADSFSDLLDSLMTITQTQIDPKLITPVITKISGDVLQAAALFKDDRVMFLKSIVTIGLLNSITPIERNCECINVLFKKYWFYIIKYESCIKNADIFESLYSSKKNASEFANFFIGSQFFEIYFSQNDSSSVINYMRKFLFEKIHNSFYQTINMRKCLALIITQINNNLIPDSISPDVALFLIDFFDKSSESVKGINLIFKELGGFSSFKALISNLPSEIQADLYRALVMTHNDDKSPGPNSFALKFLVDEIKNNEKLKDLIFYQVVLPLIDKDRDCANSMNSIVPAHEWLISDDLQAKRVVNFIYKIKHIEPDPVPECLPRLIKYLDQPQTDVNTYIECIHIIENQFLKKKISLSRLSRYMFLSIFILNTPSNFLASFFKESETFGQLSIDILALETNRSYHESVFKAVISTNQYIDDKSLFIQIVTGFLVVAPSRENIDFLIQEIQNTKGIQLIQIFINSYSKSIDLPRNFVSIGGIEWTLKLLDENEIDIQYLAEIFANLVYLYPINHLDFLINSLEKNHPIFSLDQKTLEKVVYGLHQSLHKPIRIHSLYHLLDDPGQYDPYNAWVIGKYALPHFDHIEKLPFIKHVANRWMLTSDFERILPFTELYEGCIDTKLDHFSLFQMFPGFGELLIDTTYVTLSFWFCFAEELQNEVTLFMNDVLMFTYSQTTLTVNCESQTHVTDATPTKWTHVFIVLETSFKTQSIRITIDNDYTFVMKPKTKINEFTFAKFSTTKPGSTLFIGSALRFSSRVPKDFSLIYAAGPGYIEKSCDLDEDLLVTPFELNRVDIPLNCFSVPYFGFAVHLLNNHNIKIVLKTLMMTTDPKLYESIFRSLINFNIITKNYNERFWRQLLHSIKHSIIYPSTESLISALKTVITPKTEEYVFSTLIYGGNLWEIVDNEVLTLALFECFPNINYKNFQDADIFLATVVQHNPKNPKVISTIIKNYKKLPKTFKLVVALLKTEAQDKIDLTKFSNREYTDLQINIIDCMVQIIDKKSIETFKTAMPFEELRYLFLTASRRVASRLMHLIALMSALIVDFASCDLSFQLKTATLYNYESVWHDVMFMISGHQECDSNMLRRPALVPLLLHLIWASSMVIVHTLSVGKKLNENLINIQRLINVSVKYFKPFMGKISTAVEAINIYSTFYPLIINYPVLFKKDFEFENYQPVNKIQQVTVTNLSDLVDPLWSDVSYKAKDLTFPPPPSSLETKEFIAELVKEILKISDFVLLNEDEVEIDWKSINEWILKSPTYQFITNLIINTAPTMFHTLSIHMLLSKPYNDEKRTMHVVPVIIQVMLKKGLEIQPYQYGNIFQIIHYLASLRYLNEQSVTMFRYVLEFSNFASDVLADNQEVFAKFTPHITSTLLELFAAAGNDEYEELFPIIQQHKNIFDILVQQQKMEKCWYHGFAIAYKDSPDQLQVLTSTSNVADLQNEENHNIWKQFISLSNQLRDNTKEQMKQAVSPHPSDWSYDYTRRRYISDIKHKVVMLFLLTTFEYVDSTFLIYIEKRRWANFLTRKQEMRSSLSNFRPKSYHLSPRCQPFNVPKVLSPSYNGYVGEDFTKSVDIQEFNEVAIFVDKIPRLHKQTRLNLFYQSVPEFGPALSLFNCQLLRYENPIPSIFFVFSDYLVILTFAKLKSNNIDLIPQTDIKQYHIFIEAVLLNHYGTTSLFLSRVMVVIPIKTILFMSPHSPTSLAIWTFITGHLILIFEQNHIRQILPYLEKINKSALDSFPLDNFLTQSKSNYDAFTRWKSHSIDTFQLLLSLNALSVRSFVDLDHFPVVPRLFGEKPVFEPDDFLTKKDITGLLYRILPFRYYATEDTLWNIMSYNNIPANLLCSPNCFRDYNGFDCGDYDFSHYAKNSRHFSMLFKHEVDDPANEDTIMKWVSLHFTINPPRSSSMGSLNLGGNFKKNGTAHSSPASSINPLAAKINQIKTTVINVSRRQSCLSIKNNYTGKVLYRESNSFYGLAENINVSRDGVFFVVDFAFGLTVAYKVIFSKGNPIAAQKISKFSAGAHPISTVSGQDWICATATGNKLVLWEIITGTIHRIMYFDTPINAVAFDEPIYYLWAASEDKITVVGLNGHIRGSVEMREKTTALTRIEDEPKAICGTELGHLFLLTFLQDKMTVEIKQMNSTHMYRIDKIYLQKHIKRFLSVDSHGETAQWNTEGILEVDDTPAFTSCAVCTNPTHTICQFCNKPICTQCMPKHVKGPNCLHCVAFI